MRSLQVNSVVRHLAVLLLCAFLGVGQAGAGSMTLLGVGGPAAGGGPTTTWNPSDKNASLVLSGGNLIASSPTNTGTAQGVRSVASHAIGKFYAEFVITASSNIGVTIPGMETSSASLSAIIWNNTNGVGYQPNSGNVVINGSVIGSAIQTAAVGDTICMAVDIANAAIWFRTNGGNWNNNASNNPATNTGGISLATLAAGPYFAGTSLGNQNDSITANFGGSAYAQSVPAGFGNW